MKKYSLLVAYLIPTLCFAHVTVESTSAYPGAYAKLTFRVPHGCDGSATTKITVQLPENTISVKPQVHPGWKIEMKKVKLVKAIPLHGKEIAESVSEITWSGGPLEDEYMDEFGISVKLPETTAQQLAFPVIQECQKGKLNWTEITSSGKGAHTLSFPAPILDLHKKSTKSSSSHH